MTPNVLDNSFMLGALVIVVGSVLYVLIIIDGTLAGISKVADLCESRLRDINKTLERLLTAYKDHNEDLKDAKDDL